jgi:hypothetical protein
VKRDNVMRFLESTRIKLVGYNPKSKVLELEFQAGGIYRYSVPRGVYQFLTKTTSPGALPSLAM